MPCKIYGKYSQFYPLCPSHMKEYKEGTIIKTEEGYEYKEYEPVEIKNSNCILCDKDTSNNHLFCIDCYKVKIKEVRNSFNHNRDAQKIKDHYFVLRELINESASKNEFLDNVCLMYALAEELNNIYENDYLLKRVETDILKVHNNIKFKNDKENKIKDSFNDKDFREKWPREHQCEDGHYVRSLSEMLIDNWLYNNGYLHTYEKSVFMESDPNAVVLSDFYIPKGNVYIEFWGLEDDERYAKRKQQKIKLYDDNNYNRIDLNESHLKTLNDLMPRLLAPFMKNKKQVISL